MAAFDCADNGTFPVSLQIVPQEMAENCFWIKAKEDKFEHPDLLAQLSLSFSSKTKGKIFFILPVAMANTTHTA